MKLNLGGCERIEGGRGSPPLTGFTNVDCRDIYGVDLVADVRILPFNDGSIEEIRASHIIEHFSPKEIPHVLAEWQRVLKVGGLLRVYCPNVDAIIRRYCDSGELDLNTLNAHLFGRQNYPENLHRSAINRVRLNMLVVQAGFNIVGQAPRPNAYRYDIGVQAIKL